MKSGNFHEFERICQMLIDFLNKSYKVRISKIVCDFVKDEHETVFFVGCRYFEIDNADKVLGVEDREKEKDPKYLMLKALPKMTPSEVLEDKAALVYCTLCKVAFKKE